MISLTFGSSGFSSRVAPKASHPTQSCPILSHPIQLSRGRPHSPSPSIFDKRIGKLSNRCLRSHSAPGPCGPSTPPSSIPPDFSWILLALNRCLLLTEYPGDAKKQEDMFFTGAGRAAAGPGGQRCQFQNSCCLLWASFSPSGAGLALGCL